MGVVPYAQEIKVANVSPERMFKAMVTDSNKVLPEIMPNIIRDAVVIIGDGPGIVGSTRRTNFTDGGFVMHCIEAIDLEKLTTKYSLIEGTWLGDKLESIRYEVEFKGSDDGGCTIKIKSKCFTKGDVVFKEEDISAVKGQAQVFYTDVGNNLAGHPNVCP